MNLATDPAEEHDVASEHPEIVAELLAARAEWWREMDASGIR